MKHPLGMSRILLNAQARLERSVRQETAYRVVFRIVLALGAHQICRKKLSEPSRSTHEKYKKQLKSFGSVTHAVL